MGIYKYTKDDLPNWDIFQDMVVDMWSGTPEDLVEDIVSLSEDVWQDMRDVYSEFEYPVLTIYVTDYEDTTYEFVCTINKVGKSTYGINSLTGCISY